MLTIVASLVSQLVTNPSVIRETWVRSELGRSPEEGKGYALQYAGLENSMECTVHGFAKSQDTTEQRSLTQPLSAFWVYGHAFLRKFIPKKNLMLTHGLVL